MVVDGPVEVADAAHDALKINICSPVGRWPGAEMSWMALVIGFLGDWPRPGHLGHDHLHLDTGTSLEPTGDWEGREAVTFMSLACMTKLLRMPTRLAMYILVTCLSWPEKHSEPVHRPNMSSQVCMPNRCPVTFSIDFVCRLQKLCQ